MATVEIEYCVPCGFLDRAQDLQGTLLTTFGERLDRVSLVTGDSGVFVVTVDGETIYDKAEAGGGFDVDAVVREVRERL